jgi:uncharacterized protein (TIGR02466 family)
MITPIHFFDNYILKTKFDFPWKKLESKVDHIFSDQITETHPEVKIGNSTLMSRIEEPHQWPELTEYLGFISSIMPTVAAHYDLLPAGINITNSWFNCHKPGGQSLQHEHGTVDIVVSSYPRFPKNSGRIEFKDPLEYHWHGYPKKNNRNMYWKAVDIEEGDVLIFPGWIKHRTEINNSNENRYVLTVNLNLVK